MAPTLNSWGKSHLAMVFNLFFFFMLLHSVCSFGTGGFQSFQSGYIILVCSHQQCMRVPVSLHPSQHCIACLFCDDQSSRLKWYSTTLPVCIPLMTYVLSIFGSANYPHFIFFGEGFIQIFCLCLNGIIFLIIIICKNSLYTPDTSPLSDI